MNTIKPLGAIILLILLFAATTVNAQFRIGPKVGLNATKIDGKTFKDQFNYNYLVGGFAEIGIGRRVSINPEVLFSQTSSTRDSTYKNNPAGLFNSNQLKATLNYLSFPLLLNIKVAGTLRIEAGPQYSILLSSDKTFIDNSKKAFKNGDFALLGGVQLRLSKVRLSGRYVAGLDNISDISTQEKWKSRALQLALGIAF